MKLSEQALLDVERERYLDLVNFSEEAHVPEPVIERLWKQTGGLTEPQTQKLLAGFSRKILLRRKSEKILPSSAFMIDNRTSCA